MANDIILLLGAFFAASFMSYLYRDNIFFKFSEHTLVGVRMGIVMLVAYQSIVSSGFIPLAAGRWEMLIPLILGFLVFTTFSKSLRWTSVYPSSIIIGIGIGLALRGAILAQFIDQITATIKPLLLEQGALATLDILLILVGTISSLSYFIFTKEHTGSFGFLTKIGRIFIMAAMGVSLGKRGLSFLSPAIGSMQALLTSPGYYVAAVAVILVIVDINRTRTRKNA